MTSFKIVAALAIASLAFSTEVSAQDFKFDFGPGQPAKGYTQVLPTTFYSKETGFGFERGAAPLGVDRGGRDLLKGDFITSESPMYFSVKVPEGNYRVSVTLGDLKGASETTIKAESRRLMLENVKTEAGKFTTQTFIVHIKDRIISEGVQVALKDRELTKLDWDDKLTLEFDLKTAICGLEITKVNDQVTVFLAGNSTVVNQDEEPWASWGQMITRFFKPGVAISNHAESGLSLGSFIGSRRLQKVLSIIKPGDYVFVEFGHNDEKEKGPGDGPYKSYSERLRVFATEVKAKQANLVIVTPTARRNFRPDGKMNDTHGDYPDAARKVAAEVNVPLIDLTTQSTIMFEAMGETPSRKAFVEQGDKIDNTHFNTYGAYQLAKVIVEGIKANKLGISKFLIDMPTFNPAKPDPFESFKWPPSPRASFVKPDGN